MITDSGGVEMRSDFGDGSSKVDQLTEASGGIYNKVGSGSGEKYRVVPNTGDLQMLDDDGLVRTATRLENAPKNGEC